MRKIPELDGLRAVAVMAVLGYHLAPHRLPGGYLGVDLFFVLSGFLITSLLAHEYRTTGRIDLRAFYIRRALRILPPLGAAIALAVAIGHPSAVSIASGLLFFRNLIPVTIDPLAHLWSLSAEEHFYFVWPLLFLVVRNRIRLLIAAIGIAVALRAWMILSGVIETWGLITPARMDALAVGCLIALIPLPRIPAWSTFSLILAMFFLAGIDAVMLSVGLTAFAFLSAAVIAAVVSEDGQVQAMLRHPVTRYIGSRSYGIYLYHVPVIWALRGGGYVHAITVIAVTLLIAEISYRTIEAWARAHRGMGQPRKVSVTVA